MLELECSIFTLIVIFVRIPRPLVSVLLYQLIEIQFLAEEKTPLVLPKEPVLRTLQRILDTKASQDSGHTKNV